MRIVLAFGILASLLAEGSLSGGVKDASTGLSRLTGCDLVPTNWADGDSFSVRFPDGEERTIRLYGVDCIEEREDGPYRKPEDLDRVPGIGKKILEGMEEWLEFGE